MKVPAIISDMGKMMLPALLDEAVEQLTKVKAESATKLKIDGGEYLSKASLAKLNLAMTVLRRVYHAALVLTGKAQAVQFAEDYQPLKQAAREAASALAAK